jgi:hypothetical protein
MLDKTRRSRVHSAAGQIPARAASLVETTKPVANSIEPPSGEPDRRATYNCTACGHAMRVIGLGRHRVYFDPSDQRLDDPIMDRRCPNCGHGLPGK